MKRREFLQDISCIGLMPALVTGGEPVRDECSEGGGLRDSHRARWLGYLVKLAEPVLSSLAADQLKVTMPVEVPGNVLGDRSQYTHLEAVGRLIAGIAPWLQLEEMDEEEKQIKDRYFSLTLEGLGHAVNPYAKDFLNWTDNKQPYAQPLVDAAFLAHAFIRCPKLWNALNSKTKERVLQCLRDTKSIRPGFNNWLLFAAMIEAFFLSVGEPFDIMRIDYAIKQHEQWYKGDGMYGDGAHFFWDYYNSFVIHPFLLDILNLVVHQDDGYKTSLDRLLRHSRRYAVIQERLIAPDGTFPPIGRSLVYRTGAFQHLANMAWKGILPAEISPAQARCAMTAVIAKITERNDLFDINGWLQLGLYGHQPDLADVYISTGSLYLCATILLPLGLPPSDDFWRSPDDDWSAKKIWKGINISGH